MAVFYLNLFFSTRLIVDIPSIVFFIFAALFFYRYFKKNSIKSLYIAAVLISIGTMFKQSTGFLLMAVFLYVLFTKGHKFIFKKELFIAALIFFLVMSPYLIFGYFQFGGFVLAQGASQVSPENPIMQGYTHIITYFSLFPTYLSWPLLILFLIGLVLIFKVFLGFDLLHKEGNFELKKDFFLILLFLIPIILAGFLINHTENRYIINSMPVIFIIASFGFFKIYDWIKKKNKLIPIIILILLLVYIGNFQLKATDSLISGKLDSYSEIRDSAYWFEENSLPTDIIMTTSIKQIPYYSWRKTIRFPKDESDFEELLASDSNIKFFMLSVYENSKEWAYSYPQRKNLTIATGFLRDQQPIAIIYYLNDSN
jgi:4-amino-4-deoxy-L-arabinose transferase-like glycosyltransferase